MTRPRVVCGECLWSFYATGVKDQECPFCGKLVDVVRQVERKEEWSKK